VPKIVRNSKALPEEDGSDHYAFAGMLGGGYHQFIIYDPLLDKAFCKEFVIEPSD